MSERKCAGAMLAMSLAAGTAMAVQAPLTDAQIRQQIIRENHQALNLRYTGRATPPAAQSLCICPYQTDRNGRQCAGRSLYSRPGGIAPLCYPIDVPNAEVQAYRQRHGLNRGG